MRIYLTAAILIGLLAGCSSDQESTLGKTTAASGKMLHQGATLPVTGRSAMTGFASLPNRGELLAYDHVRRVKHSGAYTAYPVALSEAHALDAMRTGEMVVNAPNGELIRLKYKSHIEHPDGNWTWIGRNSDGADALITFGEKAVFGSIPQGARDTLRLTMSAGQSFLVATDRSKLAGLDGAVRRSATDQLIPPRLAAGASGGHTTASQQPQPVGAQATGAASSVVDILLGYTNGLATQLGGQSQATTRMVSLTDITNQAYANSGVNMRVRLVGVLQVNYADNTDNGDALEKLTGYVAGTGGGPVTPDPAFTALRAKRDELGADLVALVRAFRTPENDGCGIAWLIGGGGYAIEAADAPFGYSVVGDGTDLDEGDGKTYFCRQETLAHELGHNMGQAHNTEDSSQSGTHPYSYGYRQTTNGGFYTVMAYPKKDANQFSIRYFANPTVQYNGAATGVANQSDNVRSMNISMPLVATFRATVVPVVNGQNQDANADGTDDLFWHNASSGLQQNWLMNGAGWTYGQVKSLGSQYRVAGIGDFNGDGRADILWYDTAKTTLWEWQAQADGSYSVNYLRAYPTGWDVVGVKDANGDGRADVFWHNTGSGLIQTWLMDGTTWAYGPVNPIGTQYRVAALGDFNGDGRADIIWYDTAKTTLWQWQAQTNGSYNVVYLRSYPAGWDIVGAKDANADGRDDLFWHNSSIGQQQNWLMNGASWTYASANAIGTQYRVATVGDFNGDGRADIIWYDTAKTTLWQWQGQASGAYSVIYLRSYPAGWAVVN